MNGWQLWASWGAMIGIPATLVVLLVRINRRKEDKDNG